jgi:hypothetical protein
VQGTSTGVGTVTSKIDVRPASTDYNLTTGNLNVATGGTLDAASAASTITVNGNWTRTGTFTQGSSTVLFDTSATSTLTGATTFNILTINPGAGVSKEVYFAASTAFTISTAFNVSGSAGHLVKLFSTSLGTQWTIVPPTSNTVTFADVQDSDCTHVSGRDITATSSTDDGNNDLASAGGCWIFGSPPYLNMSLSSNAVGFGTLAVSVPRYATSDLVGSTSDTGDTTGTASQYFTLSSSGSYGYSLYVQGASLFNPAASYTVATSSTNTDPAGQTEIFGMRMVAVNGAGAYAGLGAVISPRYDGAGGAGTAGFAYGATLSTPDMVAWSTASGTANERTTTFYPHYVFKTSPGTPAGSYSTTLTYISVGNF